MAMNHLFTALNVLETEYGSGQQIFIVSRDDIYMRAEGDRTAFDIRDKGASFWLQDCRRPQNVCACRQGADGASQDRLAASGRHSAGERLC